MSDQETFDAQTYINELIEAMGFGNDTEEQNQELFDTLMEGLNWEIWRAVDENVEPEVLDSIQKSMPNEEDPQVLFREIIKNSPASQQAIVEALDAYAEEVLEGAKVGSKKG